MQQTSKASQSLYLEDLRVGQRFTSGSHVVDEKQIERFATEFDPQPFHLDEAAAQRSIFRGIAASGWHTAALTMRLLVTGGLPLPDGIIGVGVELEWSKPVRPGDALHVESEIIEIVPSKSKPNQGVVRVRCTTINQKGEPVQVLHSRLLVFKRPSTETP